MGRSKNALAFVAGMGEGYMDAKRQKKLDEERQQDRDMRKQQFDAQMEEANRVKQDRIALADAAKPAVLNENAATLDMGDGPKVYEDAGVANSDLRQARSMGLADVQAPQQALAVNGTAYASRPQADAAVAAYNSPETTDKRISLAMAKAGNPLAAKQYQHAAFTMNKEQADYARKLQDEGAIDAAKALRMGDGAGMVAAFNKGGQFKIEGDPVITPKERDIPGIGRITTYDATVNIKRPDGSVIPKTFNSHDLSMQLMPFEKGLELQRKASDSDNKVQYQQGLLDTKIKQLELTGQIAEARALAAAAKATANGGPLGREERLRYTTLFSDAGRRMQDTQKTLNSLRRDPLFMVNAKKPGTPEAQQLESLQSDLKSHQDERALYQGLLAGSQGTGAKPPALADVKPTAAPRADGLITIATKAERDKLPKGTQYIGPDGQRYVKQ